MKAQAPFYEWGNLNGDNCSLWHRHSYHFLWHIHPASPQHALFSPFSPFPHFLSIALIFSLQVAIAISLASFMVGALSTGILWFIHSRALRAKSVWWWLSTSLPLYYYSESFPLERIICLKYWRWARCAQEQLRITCEGTELVGLSPNTTTINHTSNGATTGWSSLRLGNGLEVLSQDQFTQVPFAGGDHNGNCPTCPLVS